MGDIRILIDIGNSKEIFVALLKIFKYNPGWIVDGNVCFSNSNWATYPNKTARYFSIDLENMRFAWATVDSDDTARGRFQIVETVEDAISIAEFAIANAETFKCDPEKPFVPAHTTDYIPTAKKLQNSDSDSDYPFLINIEKLKEYVNSFIGFDSKLISKEYKKLETFDKYYNEPKTMMISPKPNYFKNSNLEDMYQATISKLSSNSDEPVDYYNPYPKKQ